MSHTPGPWEWDELGGMFEILRSGRGRDKKEVISLNHDYDGWGIIDNADDYALIAAAPDLLTACEDLIQRLETYRPYKQDADVVAARAAVAKARGDGNG